MGILINNGRVIDPGHIDDVCDLLIQDGKIEAVGPVGTLGVTSADHQVIDASGLWVTPGLVDMHVHFREPGQEYKEDIATGSAAAAAG